MSEVDTGRATLCQKWPWVLGSQSPRRLKLLRQAGIEPAVHVVEVAEKSHGADPVEVCRENAELKLRVLLDERRQRGEGFFLTADTIVVHEGEILGKPRDLDQGRAMLLRLANSRHDVMTAFSLHFASLNRTKTSSVTTSVQMRRVREEEIERYLASGDPLDKAGAYGIQEYAGVFVERIDGCYTNVVGLPLSRVVDLAQAWVEEYLAQ